MGHFVESLHCSTLLSGGVSAVVVPESVGTPFSVFLAAGNMFPDTLMGQRVQRKSARTVLEVKSGHSFAIFAMLSADT